MRHERGRCPVGRNESRVEVPALVRYFKMEIPNEWIPAPQGERANDVIARSRRRSDRGCPEVWKADLHLPDTVAFDPNAECIAVPLLALKPAVPVHERADALIGAGPAPRGQEPLVSVV